MTGRGYKCEGTLRLHSETNSFSETQQTHHARPYQEDYWARPRPLPMAGGQARAQDEEQGQALRPQEVLLGP